MTCPNCTTALPVDPPLVRALTICPNMLCLRTLAIEDGGARLAIDADTLALEPTELQNLKGLRRQLRRGN